MLKGWFRQEDVVGTITTSRVFQGKMTNLVEAVTNFAFRSVKVHYARRLLMAITVIVCAN
ncbi:hypothetical protein LINPERPRIM_LOCUS13695 [Linum perenne]